MNSPEGSVFVSGESFGCLCLITVMTADLHVPLNHSKITGKCAKK